MPSHGAARGRPDGIRTRSRSRSEGNFSPHGTFRARALGTCQRAEGRNDVAHPREEGKAAQQRNGARPAGVPAGSIQSLRPRAAGEPSLRAACACAAGQSAHVCRSQITRHGTGISSARRGYIPHGKMRALFRRHQRRRKALPKALASWPDFPSHNTPRASQLVHLTSQS